MLQNKEPTEKVSRTSPFGSQNKKKDMGTLGQRSVFAE